MAKFHVTLLIDTDDRKSIMDLRDGAEKHRIEWDDFLDCLDHTDRSGVTDIAEVS